MIKKKSKNTVDSKDAADILKFSEPSNDITAIENEGKKALSELGKLYASIGNPNVKANINEIMFVTDKIYQDAVEDPADIPQIKKYFNYYLPTTLKLLSSYSKMSSLGISGENVRKSVESIEDSLETSVRDFKGFLDSLFENQALDIETDIDVMNEMMRRDGLTSNPDFKL